MKEEGEEKKIFLYFDNHNKKLKDKFQQIEKVKITKDYIKIEKLYDEILELDNKNEEYIVSYLQFLLEIKNKDKFNLIFENYKLCLSDSNYKWFSQQKARKNAKCHILEYISFIKDNSLISSLSQNFKDKNLRYYLSLSIIAKISTEVKVLKFKPKKIVTWKDEELYLNKLYHSLLCSMLKIMNFYSENKEALDIASDLPQYKYYKDKVGKATNNDEVELYNDILKAIVLSESKFFDYILNFYIFLNVIDKDFKFRFGNLELSNNEDKILFEDYLHFIGNHIFSRKQEFLIYLWEETFSLLSKEQKMNHLLQIKEEQNKKPFYLKISTIDFKLNDNADTLEIKQYSDSIIEKITNIDDYSFINLLNYVDNKYNGDNLEWIKNLTLKPYNYNKKLFVCQKREIWKALLKNIFISKAFLEIIENFYGDKINIFKDDSLIDDIINNIRFFIYKTNYFGVTYDHSLKTYEYGIYINNDNNENKSIRLLIYYGFLIVCNIHEIGGHYYVRFLFFSTLDEKYHSPVIKDKDKYNDEGIFIGNESGETIEIKLFGKVVDVLTIKEALFILNINNYSQDVKSFKEKFIDCNNREYDELIPESMKIFLNLLGINEKEIIKAKDNKNFKFPNQNIEISDSNKRKNLKPFHGPIFRHPFSFYFRTENIFKSHIDTIKGEFEKLKNIKFEN